MGYLICLLLGILAGCQAPTCYDEEIIDQSYVHKYGVEVAPQDWQQRGSSGKVVSRQKNGVVVSKNYSEGLLDGETTYSFPYSDTLEKVEVYAKNQLVKEINFYRSGAPKQEISYAELNKKLLLTWFENGIPQSREEVEGDLLLSGEYYTPAHQLETQVVAGNGAKTRRDPYGHLEAVDTMQNGQVALITTYYANGSPKDETPYKKGLIDGAVKRYLPRGEPSVIEEWSNGARTGLTTHFENGERVAEIPYVNGLRTGVEKRYRNNDILVEEIGWANDLRHGPNISYINDTKRTEWFFRNEPVSQIGFDRMNSLRTY